MWSREPYEVFAIFESINEPAVDGLPKDAMAWAEYGGLCDKLMIVHPGKFCSAHFHWRKTEYYEVVLGEMDVFYAHEVIDFPELGVVADETIQRTPMPKGDPWPDDIILPKGREELLGAADLVPSACGRGTPSSSCPASTCTASDAPAMPERRWSSARTPATATSPPPRARPGCCPSGSTSTTTTSSPSWPTPAGSRTSSASDDRCRRGAGASGTAALG